MTEEQMMTMLRNMTDEADNALLTAALAYAGQEVLNRVYPYDTSVTVVPARYRVNQLNIAAYLLNKRGAEGQLVMSENGIYRSFESAAIPSSMFAGIVPFAGAIG